ncbi:MAG TPA: hypothetical protein VKU80_08225 [Planctomycetota bacterium]|nr:hypothetical protein [Planctomycetota bacterium]
MLIPNYFVYLPGGIKRDDAKVKALADATKQGLYEAKVMLGAPGPRKVGAFVKEEEALAQAAQLRTSGLNAFVIDKARFSRSPKVFKALKAVENEIGLNFSIETAPAPGQINAQFFDLPQPRGLVKAVILGAYTETKTHTDVARSKFTVSSSSKSEIREPFVHLYSEDPHTILEVRGPRFEWEALQKLQGILGDLRWFKMAELFADYYKCKLDVTLFKTPEEVNAITAALNVDAAHGTVLGGGRGGSSSVDDTPLAMAASRIIVYSLVFGL